MSNVLRRAQRDIREAGPFNRLWLERCQQLRLASAHRDAGLGGFLFAVHDSRGVSFGGGGAAAVDASLDPPVLAGVRCEATVTEIDALAEELAWWTA